MNEPETTPEKPAEDTPKAAPTSKGGPLVEDTSVVGGTDKETGAPVVTPKTPEGTADSLTEATDARENAPAAADAPESDAPAAG